MSFSNSRPPVANGNETPEEREEIAGLERMVQAFRMQELKSLLAFASQPSQGRKSEMMNRAVILVRSTKNNLVKMKVRQLYSHFFDKDRAALEANYSAVSPYGIYGSSVPPPSGTHLRFGDACGGSSTSTHARNPLTSNAARHNVELNPKVRLAALPFFDVLNTVMVPTTLVPMSLGKCQDTRMTFNLTREQLGTIALNDKTPLPRTEVQLRFCLLDMKTEQKDDFPSGCLLRLNEKLVQIPNPIPTNKVGVEAKRPSRPVDLCPYIVNRGNGDQRLHISWNHDGTKFWTVSVYLVRHLTTGILFDRVKAKGERAEGESVKMISDKLGGYDRDIAATSLRVSLLCPLGKIRMRLPCRLRSCRHLQCFDLELFLQMNEKRPTWTCPVCDAPTVPFGDLQIDGYFTRLITQTTSEGEVELYEGGGFAPVNDDSIVDLDDEDDEPPKPKQPLKRYQSPIKPVVSVPSTAAFAALSAAWAPKQIPKQQQQQPSTSRHNDSDDDCIIIESSDDEEEKSGGTKKSSTTATSGSERCPNPSSGRETHSRSSSPSIIILDTPSPPSKSTPEEDQAEKNDDDDEAEAGPSTSNGNLAGNSLKRRFSPNMEKSPPKRFVFKGYNGSMGVAIKGQPTQPERTSNSTDHHHPGLPDILQQMMSDLAKQQQTTSNQQASTSAGPSGSSYVPPYGTASYGSVSLPPPARDRPTELPRWLPFMPSSTSSSSFANTSSTPPTPSADPRLAMEFEAFVQSLLPRKDDQ